MRNRGTMQVHGAYPGCAIGSGGADNLIIQTRRGVYK